MKRQPVLLIIFDGFGLNPNRLHNGWALARTPHLDAYFATHPHTALQASGGWSARWSVRQLGSGSPYSGRGADPRTGTGAGTRGDSRR